MGNPMDVPDGQEQTQEYEVRGLGVRLTNTRPDIDSRDVLGRLAGALDLIARHAPRRFGRLRQDIQRFVVRRFPCRGAFFPETGECLVELTFTVNPRHTLAKSPPPSFTRQLTHALRHASVRFPDHVVLGKSGCAGRLSWSLDSRSRRAPRW